MKKTLGLLGVAAVVALTLTGCTGTTEPEPTVQGEPILTEVTINVTGSSEDVSFVNSLWFTSAGGRTNNIQNPEQLFTYSDSYTIESPANATEVDITTAFKATFTLPPGESYECVIEIDGEVVAEHTGEANTEENEFGVVEGSKDGIGCSYNDTYQLSD